MFMSMINFALSTKALKSNNVFLVVFEIYIIQNPRLWLKRQNTSCYAPYPAKGQALPKAMNGQGWVGCICIFFRFCTNYCVVGY